MINKSIIFRIDFQSNQNNIKRHAGLVLSTVTKARLHKTHSILRYLTKQKDTKDEEDSFIAYFVSVFVIYCLNNAKFMACLDM